MATIRQYPMKLLSLLGGLHISDEDYREIMKCIKYNGASAGNDGSVQDGKGRHAFYISDNAFILKIWGYVPTVGLQRGILSLPAEHGGVLGILLLIQALYIYY